MSDIDHSLIAFEFKEDGIEGNSKPVILIGSMAETFHNTIDLQYCDNYDERRYNWKSCNLQISYKGANDKTTLAFLSFEVTIGSIVKMLKGAHYTIYLCSKGGGTPLFDHFQEDSDIERESTGSENSNDSEEMEEKE